MHRRINTSEQPQAFPTVLLAHLRRDLEAGRRNSSAGCWANVVRCRIGHGGRSAVRFPPRSFLARNLLALSGARIVDHWSRNRSLPREALKVDAFSSRRFLLGRSLRGWQSATRRFFRHWSAPQHARPRGHLLDLRNADNILRQRKRAALLDSVAFEHAGCGPLRRFAQEVDFAAIYKHWARLSPETLGTGRAALLARMNRLRPFWVLSGRVGARRSGSYAAR
jgi:hypothetical protein